MTKRNPQIAAKTIVRSEGVELREPVRDRVEKRHYASVAERVAQSSVCIRNWKFPGAAQAFPLEPAMRSIEQYYPYAAGGALMVDVPVTHGERLDCERKAKYFSEIGLRYLIVEADTDEYEAQKRLRG